MNLKISEHIKTFKSEDNKDYLVIIQPTTWYEDDKISIFDDNFNDIKTGIDNIHCYTEIKSDSPLKNSDFGNVVVTDNAIYLVTEYVDEEAALGGINLTEEESRFDAYETIVTVNNGKVSVTRGNLIKGMGCERG